MILPTIDFANHPAYAPFVESITPDERKAETDRYAAKLAAARRNLAKFQHAWGSPNRHTPPGDGALFRDLVNDGITRIHLPGALKSMLQTISVPYMAGLEEQLEDRNSRSGGLATTRLSFEDLVASDFMPFLKAFLNEFEIMPLISAYLGLPKIALKVMHIKLTNTTVSVTRGVIDVFQDQAFPDPPTRYFHVDAPPCDLKVIFYLSEVTDIAHGPFSYVSGTHSAPYASLEEFAVRAATTDFIVDRSASGRKSLMCLPEMYRQRIDFGSDLAPDLPISQSLLERERIFYSNEADGVLFDSKGTHRGAMVSNGTRAVVQLTFQAIVD